MASTTRITDPIQLLDPLTQRETLDINHDNASSTPREIVLVLLQPLVQQHMLSRCRDPHPRTTLVYQSTVFSVVVLEWLIIQPLSTAWRQAWSQTKLPDRLVFDIRMSLNTDDNEVFEPIQWDTVLKMRPGRQCAISIRDLKNLVVTLATASKMRSDRPIQFDVIYDQKDFSSGNMDVFKQQLDNISAYKMQAGSSPIKTPATSDKSEQS